jgi:hypothetical protein
MLWDPTTRVEMVTEAAPELIGIVPRLVAPSLKVIVPVAPAATVAVSVTVLPKVEGFNDEVRLRFEEAWFTV